MAYEALGPEVPDGDMAVTRQDAMPIQALFSSGSSNIEMRAG